MFVNLRFFVGFTNYQFGLANMSHDMMKFCKQTSDNSNK